VRFNPGVNTSGKIARAAQQSITAELSGAALKTSILSPDLGYEGANMPAAPLEEHRYFFGRGVVAR
jgi:hypothetical protein